MAWWDEDSRLADVVNWLVEFSLGDNFTSCIKTRNSLTPLGLVSSILIKQCQMQEMLNTQKGMY